MNDSIEGLAQTQSINDADLQCDFEEDIALEVRNIKI